MPNMFPAHDLAGFGIYLRDDKWVMRGDKVMGVWDVEEVRILNEDEPDELEKLGLDWETDDELKDNIPHHEVFARFLGEASELYGWEETAEPTVPKPQSAAEVWLDTLFSEN